MKRQSLSTTRRPVVLLVQASRDDSLEMYAEFLHIRLKPVVDVVSVLTVTGKVQLVRSAGDVVIGDVRRPIERHRPG